MAAEEIEIPDLAFGFYYPDILRALIEFKRRYVPELTDENPREPSVQFMRACAAVVHQANCVTDMAAQESLLSTARLTESVREHLRPLGYLLAPARPSKVELVCKLTKVFTALSVVIPDTALFSTQRDPDSGITIYFEADDQVSVNPTNELTAVLAYEAGLFTDFTTEANSPTTPGDDWQPWVSPNAGDAVYFCHDSIMWDRLDTFATLDTEDGGFGVWEYFSGDYAKAQPDSVEKIGPKLRMSVNGYLGTENRDGTIIRVQINSTTLSEDVEVFWTGTTNVIETESLLGQSDVSTDPDDYTVGSAWEPLPDLTSTSELADLYFGVDADQISWTLPQSVNDAWNRTTIEGVEGYWIRFRWIEAPLNGPTVQYVDISNASQYVSVLCTQGRTITDSPLGSSDGTPNQIFLASKSFFIEADDELLVDGLPWTRVENFILSGPTDEHYQIKLTGDDDRAQIVFGNGVLGKVPPVGVSNIEWTYRYGANDDGNVGANTVTVDRSSLAFIGTLYNPRQASGWSAAEGSSTQSLEEAKQRGPAKLRVPNVALSPADLVDLTLRYVDDNGASPFSRAFAIEEGFGPKTVELVCVHRGGDLATTQELDELDLFFNGDKNAIPPIPSHFIANQKVVATNYTPRTINVTADVYVATDISEEIENRLIAVLDPEAKKSSGAFEWQFGSEVSLSRLDFEIHGVSPKISKVVISEPASNIQLSSRQLPNAGTITINIVKPGS